MLKIGDFSKLSRVSIRMLRHYDEIGLLVPATVNRFSGYRYYSEDQLLTAAKIAAYRDMGFGLSAIGGILKGRQDKEALEEFLSIQRTETQKESDNVQRRLRLLDEAINRLRKGESIMEYQVSLKTLPERYVASVRQVIPGYDKESILWNTLMQETADIEMKLAQNCYSLAIFHDKEFRETDVDVEIQGTVEGHYADTEHVKFKTVAPVEVASVTYKGSYEQITPVNHAVASWVRDNGYDFDGPMFCIYHVSPAQTQNPDELITEVCYPVKAGTKSL